jgi:hypothetical protein
MPLIVEDGTGVENANSYATVGEADAYYALRGESDWAGVTADADDKAAALIKAADYLNAVPPWLGVSISSSQTMVLPTTEVGEVPYAVKQAQLILAKEAALGDLSISPLGDVQVLKIREKLEGVGEVETEYADQSSSYVPMNSTVFGLLKPWIRQSGGLGLQTARRSYA